MVKPKNMLVQGRIIFCSLTKYVEIVLYGVHLNDTVHQLQYISSYY